VAVSEIAQSRFRALFLPLARARFRRILPVTPSGGSLPNRTRAYASACRKYRDLVSRSRIPTSPSGLTLVPEMFSWGMSVLFEINRDFPYQVALPFDEVAMEVLAWLEGRSFEWDMYVDLPAAMVRYCFQTSADATAFRRRFVDATQRRTVVGGN